MSVINILSPHVADMIAAGEVVERPASIIKELMENSFDAGASSVTVEIRGGGSTYIRVSDNGCGMSPEDAGVAFLRHATSKLHDERGLEAIGTMGFRGEALAAISSVSEIELLTRRRGEDAGCYVSLSAGDIQDMHAAGCPEGTVMTVKSVFFNTPARLKFLKSDRSEASACVQTALRCALGRPEISVRLIRDGREEFFSPGDGRADSCIYALLGRELAKDMLPCEWLDNDIRLHGFVSSPAGGRGSRAMQFFYCNGRYIRSALLQSALEQAYRNTLLTGRFPACVLYLELNTSSVDVNVHPAKTEVKFSEEKRVFDAVYQAALAALTGEQRVPVPVRESEKPQPEQPEAKPADEYAAPAAPETDAAQSGYYSGEGMYTPRTEIGELFIRRRNPSIFTLRSSGVPYGDAPAGSEPPETGNVPEQLTVEKAVQNVEKSPMPAYKIVGEALKLYIIVEVEGSLLLIDKHAAHERMIFDRLRAQDSSIMSQTLLTPITLRTGGDEGELIEKNAALFDGLGFCIEPFGDTEYIIRAVPADILTSDAAAAVEEICEALRGGGAPDAKSVRDEALHTVACKAAIKAGWNTEPQELARIAEAVLSGEVRYCPHGRPVSVTVTRKELDKLFKRIV